jgi:hypothetical protein
MNVKKKPIENEFEIINILEMAKIIYNDEKMDIFNAIYKANKGVYIGRIINQNEFKDTGFIPKENIKKIIGGIRRKMLKKKLK